MTVLV